MNRLISTVLLLACLFASVFATDATDDSDIDSVVVILFMFAALTVCCLIMHVLSRFNDIIPYTVVVFLFGIGFSGLADVNGLSVFGQSLNEWINIDADLVLFVFLPVLIFGEAMNLNWHHVQGALYQSFLLAGPGVLLGAFLMACLVKLVLPHDWSWNMCLTFGSILAATDPVAVVALLKDAGAAPKLTILIVGESLMNDGTAMVLFTLFFNMLQGQSYTAGDVVLFFIKAAVGSPLLGIILGMMMVRWMKLANRPLKEIDTTIQIIVTVCGAYIIFFLAQYTFEISGVLACCGGGIILCWLSPPLVLNHETMHNVWSFLEWMGNSLIFLVAGLIMGHRTFQHVSFQDWVFMILIYLLLFVVRIIVIAVLFPLLSTSGHKCTVPEAAFMAWSGLRGALAIALALIVATSTETDESEVNLNRFLFYIGGVAAMSIFINGTLAKSVLHFLGLIGDETEEKEIVMNAIKKRLRHKMSNYIDNLEEIEDEAEAEDVRASMSLFNKMELPDSSGPSSTGKGRDSNAEQNLNPRGSTMVDEDAPLFIGFHGEVGELKKIVNNNNNDSNNNHPDAVNPLVEAYANTADIETTLSTDNMNSPGLVSTSMFDGLRKSRSTSNVARLRAGSMSHRNASSPIMKDLMAYVRTVFLELIRVHYWKLIKSNKLPRVSHSANFLLYSIDVGLDDVERVTDGLRDWHIIEEHLDDVAVYIKITALMASISISQYFAQTGESYSSLLLAFFLNRREKRAVYILTSYIEAHEHAQKKIHRFLGGGEERSPSFTESAQYNTSATPEEILVIHESKRCVQKAQLILDMFSTGTVRVIKAKQKRYMILSKQVELVRGMVDEGLLSNNHAELFIEDIMLDFKSIGSEQTRAMEEQAQELKNTIAEEKERNTLTSLNFVVRASHASAVQGGYGYNADGSRSQRNTSAEIDIASLGGKDDNHRDMTNNIANP